MCTCVTAPPRHDDLPSVVWPAGKTACVRVSRLLPDTATCEGGLASREDRLCTCVALLPNLATCREWSRWQVRPLVYVCRGSSLTRRPAKCGVSVLSRRFMPPHVTLWVGLDSKGNLGACAIVRNSGKYKKLHAAAICWSGLKN